MRSFTVSLLLTVLILSVNSEPGHVKVDIKPTTPTTTVAVALNQVVDIMLETCFNCKNEWILQSSPNATILVAKSRRSDLVPKSGLGTQVFSITPNSNGKATLTFIYRHIEDKRSATAIAKVILHVHVFDPQTLSTRRAAPTTTPTTIPISTPGPAPVQISLTPSSPRSSITATLGQTLAVVFESCGTCGYQWVQLSSTPDFLVPGSTGAYTPPVVPAGSVGGNGQQLFSYAPLAPGSAAVAFGYGPAWTPGVYASQVTVDIAVAA